MSKTMQELRESREEAAVAARQFMANFEAKQAKDPELRFSGDDEATYNTLLDTVRAWDRQIEAKRAEQDLGRPENAPRRDAGERHELERDAKSPKALYDRWLRNGWEGFSHEEIQEIRNTMSTTTDSEGGYTIQTDIASTLIEKLAAFGGMRAVATPLRTSKGNPMSWPTSDGTSEEGEIVAENAAATDADISFGTVGLGVYKFSSKVVTVPWELMQDSEVDIEAVVNARLQTRLARIGNRLFTVGTGTAQPRGVVTASGAGKVGASGQTATVIYDDLVDLFHAVDPAYRDAAGWMMHDDTMQVIQKLKDSTGRPLLWADMRDLSQALPMRILGRGVTINQHMATPAANAKSILFGDFGKYMIRDVMQVTLFRFTDSAYTKKGQVGFLAWMRSGGNFMDIGDSMKHYAHAAS